MIRSCSTGLSDQRSWINSDKVQTPAEEIAELHRMNRCMVTGVSGWHRMNRRGVTGALCSVYGRPCGEDSAAPDKPTPKGRIIRPVQPDYPTHAKAPSEQASDHVPESIFWGSSHSLKDRIIRGCVGQRHRSNCGRRKRNIPKDRMNRCTSD